MQVQKAPRRVLKRKIETTVPHETRKLNPENNSCESYDYDVYSEHNYSIIESPRKRIKLLENMVEKKNEQLRSLRKENINCKRKCDRQSEVISTLKTFIKDLKEKNLIHDHTQEVLQNNFSEVMFDLIKRSGAKNGEYSDNLKKFALTLNFYSPAAYEYVRQCLNKANVCTQNILCDVQILHSWQCFTSNR